MGQLQVIHQPMNVGFNLPGLYGMAPQQTVGAFGALGPQLGRTGLWSFTFSFSPIPPNCTQSE